MNAMVKVNIQFQQLNDAKLFYMMHGSFSEKEFAPDPAYPKKPYFSQIEYINDASTPVSEYWVPSDFDILMYYRPGHLKGHIKISLSVSPFPSEDFLRSSQFGPYSNCSLEGFGTVKPWWWVDPNEGSSSGGGEGEDSGGIGEGGSGEQEGGESVDGGGDVNDGGSGGGTIIDESGGQDDEQVVLESETFTEMQTGSDSQVINTMTQNEILNNTEESSDSSIGIILGSLAAVSIVALLIYYCFVKDRKRKRLEQDILKHNLGEGEGKNGQNP